MSKSLKRVKRHAEELGLDIEVVETAIDTHTAAQAAQSQGCAVDQIAKSIIFRGETSGAAILFLTAGGNRVDADKAAALAGELLGKADAALIRSQTGFAIGGVSPIGHLNPIKTFMDPRLLDFDTAWAAAGTPRHVFAISPKTLVEVTQAKVQDFTLTPQS
ncbi:YbaK/EbsC family protein [Roseobacter sp. N2S]|uniref:YbaK/EbsC family protein n=1 Tax=Roseobacter sp. N2S TaxID=2663844 RepID=UPI00285F9934|nr:YbaK/EbsC family protein [Roseobacter sp. N2S]MDR6264638.1 prolyl-tRNA editing enzyme YbaK/EbsC (Cys-tRNA(Pro) deacylase) [Roseobacter sp. N2S]